MGVEDTTKTDTRTDTTDKPTSSERPYSPPPDNPGSPGQPSRLESLARAREQQQGRSQETQDKGAGPKPAEERDDKATSEQTGSGNEKAEASGKPETEDQDKREDDDRPGTDQPGQKEKREQEPRSQDEGTTAGREPDTGTPGQQDRDRPQDQAAEPRADTRTEPADRPASSERRWTPPPDNPGSPGQPSRLESLARARAREAQQENGSPHTENTDTGTRPTEQRDDQPTTVQPESGGNELDTGGRPSGPETKEARDDSGSEGTGSWEGSERRRAEPTNVEPVRDARPPGESGEVKTDGPGAANGPAAEGGRDPNAEPATVGRPRAESIARAIERQKAEAEGANASGTDTPRPVDAGVGRGEAPGTGNRLDDSGEASNPQAGDDRTDAGQRDDGEPSEPEASEPVDAEAAHPARGDGLGRRASAEDLGATDGAEPSAHDREPVMAEAAEPQQRTDEPETDGPKAAEGDNPAVAEPPDAAGAFAEPSLEAADQPTERTQDVANDGEGGPEGAAAPDLGRERDDAELADEDEAPEPSPVDGEEANEIPDGSGDDNDDHGRNAEEQPESPASEEDNPVIYRIRMPDGEEFGPPDTDRWVYHRGRLDPINENQDLFEPDPENGDRMRRILRASRDNPDDAEKNLDEMASNMLKALDKPPPGQASSSQDTRPEMDNIQGGQQDLKAASALVGAAVAAMVIIKAVDVTAEKVKNSRSRNDDGD